MKFRNLLQQADYTLILPMENVFPLDLILRKEKNIFTMFSPNEGSLIHSSLKDLFVMSGRGSQYPDVKEQALPGNLRGSDLVDGSSSFAANFIAKARFQASSSVKKSQKMLFFYKDARELSVNLIKLDEYLLYSKLNSSSLTFSEAVKEGNIYIITSVLTSKKLELKNAGHFDFAGDVTADVLTDSVDGTVNATYTATDNYVIGSTGTIPLTFAIKAVRILFGKDKFRIKPERINVRGEADNSEYISEEEIVLLE
jgi:hypothetical protein